MPEEQLEHLALSDESIYKSVSLTKGQVNEARTPPPLVAAIIITSYQLSNASVYFNAGP